MAVGGQRVVEGGGVHPQRAGGDLAERPVRAGLRRLQEHRQAEHALVADGRDLDLAALDAGDQRDDALDRKVDVLDRSTLLEHPVPDRERDDLQLRREPHQLLLGERVEQPVLA